MKDQNTVFSKRQKIAVILLTVLSVAIVAAFIGVGFYALGGKWYAGNIKTFDFRNADSVTVSDMDGTNAVTLDGEDKSLAESFCSAKNAVSEDVEIPACFFDTVEITIVKDGKTYTVYPSGDDCRNLAIDVNGKTYYGAMTDSMDAFKEVLKKNGIAWYWG